MGSGVYISQLYPKSKARGPGVPFGVKCGVP